MDNIHPCYCNGTRGTDCDWCQGSGFRSKYKHLSVNPRLNKPSSKTKEQVKGDEEKMYLSSVLDNSLRKPKMEEELMSRIDLLLKCKLSPLEINFLLKHIDFHLNEMHIRLAKANSKIDELIFTRDYKMAKYLKKAFIEINRNDTFMETEDANKLINRMIFLAGEDDFFKNPLKVHKKIKRRLFPKKRRS